MIDPSTLGITPSSSVQSAFQFGYNNVVTSVNSATAIGNLSQDSTSLNVLGSLSSDVPTDVYSFNFTSGSSLVLGFQNLENTTNLQVRLFDSAGNVIADSAGTSDQQAAFNSLTSSTGLAAGTGQYYIQVNYAAGAKTDYQDYNFQLYSGTTYNSSLTTTALTQAYDPNLFTSVTSSLAPAANIAIYTRSATLLPGTSVAQATQVGTLTNNQQAIDVNGGLTAGVPLDNYAFNVDQTGSVKLGFGSQTNTAAVHFKVLDSTGKNVIADNQGTDQQKYAYLELTSGAGLNLHQGQYIIQSSFNTGQLESQGQSYSFQLYQGSAYSSFYTTTASASSAQSTYKVGNNLNIFANYNATTASRQAFNVINATASSAINIGWLQENKTSLNVLSQLTTNDKADYYNFTLQSGNSVKLALTNQTDTSAPHIQILDPSGIRVLADNQGTRQQQSAFTNLTSDLGLNLSAGQYLIKVSYGKNSNTAKPLNYDFNLYDGSQFTTQYKTIASAQTLGNFLLSGGSFGATSSGQAAAYLTNLSNGTIPDITSTLSTVA